MTKSLPEVEGSRQTNISDGKFVRGAARSPTCAVVKATILLWTIFGVSSGTRAGIVRRPV
jgi:hypothetical protein